jgi:hypothetical protein
MKIEPRFYGLLLMVALVTLSMTIGCSTVFPNHRSLVQEHWGESVEENTAAMIANPEAGAVGEPLALDPKTGELVVRGYLESQKKAQRGSGVPSIIQIDATK